MLAFLRLCAGVGLVALAISNPSSADYSDWVRKQVTAETQGDPLVALITYAIGNPLIEATTERKNLLFFSVFATRLDETHQAMTLGVAGRFYPVQATNASWKPGAPSSAWPHVVAAATPNTWKPEDGYVWVRQPPNGDLRVRWQSGRQSENFAHLISAPANGRWLPEDGYVWNVDPPPVGQLGVHWIAGRPSTKFEHIASGNIEGRWYPLPGYKWLTTPPPKGDLRTVPVTDASVSDPAEVTKNQRDAGCTKSGEQLLCPGPGTGLCWAKGHDPYRDEPPMAIDVGNRGAPDFGRSDLCSRGRDALSLERALLFGVH